METVFELIDKLKLTEIIKALPKGLETQISSEGKQINASTVQKIVLARCIINQPNLLFLENPLDKIDEQNSKEILDFLCDEKQPWTLVVVSKNNYWKQICKQTIVLNQGTIKTN
jgi:ABC-type bacteriocin/lantibiotic exporter with double-glycine peptidase domain